MNELLPLACTLIALYAVVRAVIERNTLRKLLYMNILGFSVSGLIVLILPHPLAIAAAAAFFVGTTLEANAISSTIAKREEGN